MLILALPGYQDGDSLKHEALVDLSDSVMMSLMKNAESGQEEDLVVGFKS